MDVERYTAGFLLLAAVVGLSALATEIVVRRRLLYLHGVERWLARALLLTLAVVLAHLVPGALGLLAPLTVVATGLAMVGLATLVPDSGGVGEGPDADGRRRGRLEWPSDRTSALLWGGALVGAWVVATYAIAFLADNLGAPTFAYDQTAFRLPTLERWNQSGSLWGLELMLPRKNTGSYPQNGDILTLAVLLPWDNDAFVRFVAAPFAAMGGASVYACCRVLRVSSPIAVAASAALIGMPVVGLAAFSSGLPDTMAVATFGAGLAFLLRHHRSHHLGDLALAGIGLGLALGTKWYGLQATFLILMIWTFAWLLARRGPARVAVDRALIAVGLGVAGGFWFLRNLIDTGNPFYPLRLEMFGGPLPLLDAPVDLEQPIYGLSIAQYLDDPAAIGEHVVSAWWSQFALAGPLIGIAVVVGLGLGARRLVRGGSDEQRQVVLLALFAALMFVGYLITPYSGQGFGGEPNFAFVNTRWLVPALLAGAVVAAWLVDRSGPARLPLTALLAIAAVDGAHRGVTPDRWSLIVAGLVILAAAGAAFAISRRGWPLGRRTLAATGVAAAAAFAVGGFFVQREHNEDRYLGEDPALDAVLRMDGDLEIGIAGEFGARESLAPWALFGQDLDNEVEYVGEVEDSRLVPSSSAARWRSRIREGDYDLLLVSNERHLVPEDPNESEWAPRIEWLDPIAVSDRFTLYEVRPADT